MPLYEYQCDACGTRLEKIRKFSDPPLEICERCGGKLTKLLSSPAIQFKGSGWYITDYARKGDTGEKSDKNKPDQKAPAGGESAAGKSESSTTETKSDSKSGDSKSAATTAAKE